MVQNPRERDVQTAAWAFPLYLLAINLFVLPIALAGLLHFPDGSVDADTFVLTLPLAEDAPWLALLVYIGGLSAATAMVIVASVAISTMMCNDLLMPVLLRQRWLRLEQREDLSGLLLAIRRGSIVVVGTWGGGKGGGGSVAAGVWKGLGRSGSSSRSGDAIWASAARARSASVASSVEPSSRNRMLAHASRASCRRDTSPAS